MQKNLENKNLILIVNIWKICCNILNTLYKRKKITFSNILLIFYYYDDKILQHKK